MSARRRRFRGGSQPRSSALTLSTLALVVGLGLLSPPIATAQVRLGSEFQVNTFTNGSQDGLSVAADGDGDFVIVWGSQSNQDGQGWGVFGRRFSSVGAALASEFQVNRFTYLNQTGPSVAAESNGDFVVTWGSYGQDNLGYGGWGVFARRFSSAGTALGDEFQVNVNASDDQIAPSMAGDGDGDYVVAWHSQGGQDGDGDGVFARRFSSAGTALASEFQVNTHTSGNQFWPWVAADSNGDFVIVWNSNHDGDFSGVFGRRFSSSGVALATEFQVNTYTSGVQGNSSVAADADGDFVVAWPSPQDGAGTGVFARRFSSAGVALATEFQVNTHTLASEYGPAVAAETDGDFVIAWRGLQDGSGYSAHARRFSSTGTPLATEFQINSHITFNQMDPAVAIGGDGDFVVAWPSQLQDGSSYGVFAQRFQPQRILDVDGDGVIAALTDGLLVLRFTFGFDGAVLTNGAVNLAGCTRCDASTIVPYLETLE